jgi:hypothetical protein
MTAKLRSRAWRGHHEIRIKHRVRQYYGGYAKDKPRQAGRIAHARQPCSCWMCGNRRRHLRERSLQERRAFQAGDPRQGKPDRRLTRRPARPRGPSVRGG